MKRSECAAFDQLPGPNLDPAPQDAAKLEKIEVP